MLNRWGRNVWRYLEPSLVQLVWLDPGAAAAYMSSELPPTSVVPPRRAWPFEPVLVLEPGEQHDVA